RTPYCLLPREASWTAVALYRLSNDNTKPSLSWRDSLPREASWTAVALYRLSNDNTKPSLSWRDSLPREASWTAAALRTRSDLVTVVPIYRLVFPIGYRLLAISQFPFCVLCVLWSRMLF